MWRDSCEEPKSFMEGSTHSSSVSKSNKVQVLNKVWSEWIGKIYMGWMIFLMEERGDHYISEFFCSDDNILIWKDISNYKKTQSLDFKGCLQLKNHFLMKRSFSLY